MSVKRYAHVRDYLSSEYTDFDPNSHSKRLTSLYSDFTKLAVLNEFGYNANIDYWRSLLLDCSLKGYFLHHGYTLVLDKDLLSQELLWHGQGKPLALHCVLTSMEKTGDVMTLSSFDQKCSDNPSSNWSWWLYQKLPGLPFRQTSSLDSRLSLYVVMPSVKTISQHIYQTYLYQPVKTRSNSLLTFAEFRQQYGHYDNHALTEGDLILILKYLASQSKLALSNNVQGYGSTFTIVKFSESGSAIQVTEQDKAMVSIKTTCNALEYQVHKMQEQVERLTLDAKEHHLRKRRPQALYALRRRNHITDVLDKRLKSLETMENMLLKMETAQDDQQIIQAFENGANALRGVLSNGLSVSSVEETMTKIQDVYDDQKETEEAMLEGTKSLAVSDDLQLDEEALLLELEELEREEQASSQTDKPTQSPHTLPSSLSSSALNTMKNDELATKSLPSVSTLLLPSSHDQRRRESSSKVAQLE